MRNVIPTSRHHLISLFLILGLCCQAQAGIIDNTPATLNLQYFASTGPDIAGGTFFADDTLLDAFLLDLVFGDGTFSAIVMSVVAGVPDSLLWSSGPIATPATATALLFDPDVNLAIGTEYFIGIDTGQLTAAFGSVALGFTGSSFPGNHYENLNLGTWFSVSHYDIAARIEMTSASITEPTTIVLYGLGLLAMGFVRQRIR